MTKVFLFCGRRGFGFSFAAAWASLLVRCRFHGSSRGFGNHRQAQRFRRLSRAPQFGVGVFKEHAPAPFVALSPIAHFSQLRFIGLLYGTRQGARDFRGQVGGVVWVAARVARAAAGAAHAARWHVGYSVRDGDRLVHAVSARQPMERAAGSLAEQVKGINNDAPGVDNCSEFQWRLVVLGAGDRLSLLCQFVRTITRQ